MLTWAICLAVASSLHSPLVLVPRSIEMRSPDLFEGIRTQVLNRHPMAIVPFCPDWPDSAGGPFLQHRADRMPNLLQGQFPDIANLSQVGTTTWTLVRPRSRAVVARLVR